MRVIETKVYTLDELSEKAKKAAIEGNRGMNIIDTWYDFVYEDTTAILECLGFSIIGISFSGFSSQGDGASFTGDYHYNPKWKEEMGKGGYNDAEFLKFGQELQEARDAEKEDIAATLSRNGYRSFHENSVSISVWDAEDDRYPMKEGIEGKVSNTMRSMMREIYKRLEREYDYLTGDEAVQEAIKANEYEFTEEGVIV